MNTDMSYINIIVGMAIVTFLPRMLPLTILSRKEIPAALTKFLGYIPAAVLSALLLPSVLMVEGKITLGPANPLSLAALITLPVALKTKNMFATVLFGMVIMIILQRWG